MNFAPIKRLQICTALLCLQMLRVDAKNEKTVQLWTVFDEKNAN
jgi:hypothetical protein